MKPSAPEVSTWDTAGKKKLKSARGNNEWWGYYCIFCDRTRSGMKGNALFSCSKTCSRKNQRAIFCWIWGSQRVRMVNGRAAVSVMAPHRRAQSAPDGCSHSPELQISPPTSDLWAGVVRLLFVVFFVQNSEKKNAPANSSITRKMFVLSLHLRSPAKARERNRVNFRSVLSMRACDYMRVCV